MASFQLIFYHLFMDLELFLLLFAAPASTDIPFHPIIKKIMSDLCVVLDMLECKSYIIIWLHCEQIGTLFLCEPRLFPGIYLLQ